MKTSEPVTITSAIGQGTALVRRARELMALDRVLRDRLPKAIQPHVRVGNVRSDTLVLLVDSPVWKAKLRLEEPAMLALASESGLDVTRVESKVSMEVFRALAPDPPAATPRSLAPDTLRDIETTADHLEDAELQQALRNLAKAMRRG